MFTKSFAHYPSAAAFMALLSLLSNPTAAADGPRARLDVTPASQVRESTDDAPVIAPAVAPLETVDQYARRLLEERLTEVERVEEPPRPANAGQMGPAQFELIYITGTGSQARALIRLNKQYAKLAGSGEALAGWVLADIGPDYVDIYKDEDQARIYLFSSAQASLRN